ncbi:Ig-like domain repeat protein [Variovorax ginsengisoli]|uniref:Ig-like domain repeat protein n=1 Tax=Variovorax ginsengisoli TaxID=363844 RepID=A0ABT8SFQ7_9BURK|nr:Ig-like domain repeat protein [Variovorax ginsengisoli]MDN8618028.1 Ig-like domain repeat protein [Variovorax ginsengisoli]MDO1537198.1 Ig-like domain repeat protein [Variovorax ginsengisoli]
MVAIVSGNSLGLSLTSLTTLGQRGVIGTAGQGRSGEQSFVNIATGNLVLQDFDDSLQGRGPDIANVRTYNSQGLMTDDNGDNWAVGAFGQRLQLSGTAATPGSTLTRTDRDGAQAVYIWDTATSRYTSLAGAGAMDTIAYDEGASQFVWTDGDTGLVERYQATGQGRLLNVSDPNGNTVTYAYNANGTVQSATSANGEVTWYDYTGTNLAKIRTVDAGGNTLTAVHYTYDGSNRLSSVVVDLTPADNSVADGKTYVTTYTYDGASKRVASVTQTDGTNLSFEYVQVNGVYKVQSVTDALGAVTRFGYTKSRNGNPITTVTDALGAKSVYYSDAEGRLGQMRVGVTDTNALGVSLVNYTYDSDGNVVQIVDGEDNKVRFEYDASGNLLTEVDAFGNTRVRTYGFQNQLLTDTIYANAAVSAGIFSKDAALPETARYVYSASNPRQLRFAVGAQGNVTEYRYDSYGLRTSAIEYQGSLFDTTALAQSAVPTVSDMLTWSAAQDLKLTQRIDYTYDGRGELATSTSYASVASNGIGNTAGAAVTQYVYDSHGRLVQRIEAGVDGGTTQYVYDGLGRLTSTSGPSLDGTTASVTITAYDDVNGRTTVTLANGLSTVSAFDHAGRLVSVTQTSVGTGVLGTTSYFYDADGNLLMTQDPTGARAWQLYDEAGRKVADIDATGALTEYVYNANDQLRQTVAYTARIDTSLLIDGSGQPTTAWKASGQGVGLELLRPESGPDDQKVWRFYDTANRLTWQVDGAGYVTKTTYDGASRILSIKQQARPVDVEALGNGANIELLIDPESVGGITMLPSQDGSDTLIAELADGEGASGVVTFFEGDVPIGSAVVVNGRAELVAPAMPLGTHQVRAAYSGDGVRPASISSSVQIVHKVQPEVTVTEGNGYKELWEEGIVGVRFEGRDGYPRPTGQVKFYNGDTFLGEATLVDGAAVLRGIDFPLGFNMVFVDYVGDELYSPVLGAWGSIQVTPNGTDTTAKVSYSGSDVVISANVRTRMGTTSTPPNGTVEFYSGDTLIGSVQLSGGNAVLQVPFGSLDGLLSVQYLGETDNRASDTGYIWMRPRWTSATSLSVSPASGTQDDTFVLVAQVAGSMPDGVVTFLNGTTVLGTATVVDGYATLAVNNLPQGLTALQASYAGDDENLSSATPQTIGVSVAAGSGTAAPLHTTGTGTSNVWISRQVATAGEPFDPRIGWDADLTGTFSYFVDGVLIGSKPVEWWSDSYGYVPGLAPGQHTIQVVYSGDANFQSVESPIVDLEVAPARTSLELRVDQAYPYVAYAPPYKLTAFVNPSASFDPGYGWPDRPLPTGVVTFYLGDTIVGTSQVIDGVATLSIDEMPNGAEMITAVYSGDAYAQSSEARAFALVREHSQDITTFLSVSKSSATFSNYGVPIRLTATIAEGVTGGTVKFYSYNTGALLGAADMVDGTATIEVSDLPPGDTTVSAVYSGAGRFTPMQEVLAEPLFVAKSESTTVLTASASTASTSDTVTLTAAVSGADVDANGMVTFASGKTVLGMAPVINGVATLDVNNLQVGVHSIQATYSGNATNATSATTLAATITVTPGAAVAPLYSTGSQNPALSWGWSYFATVGTQTYYGLSSAGNASSLTGSFLFFDGDRLIGSYWKTDLDAEIWLSMRFDSLGSRHLTVVYSGDANFAGQVLERSDVNVGAATTKVVLESSGRSYEGGSPTTLTANVLRSPPHDDSNVAALTPAPTGLVTFYSDDLVIGTAPIVDGKAVLSISLPAGSSRIYAVYDGDDFNSASFSYEVQQDVDSEPFYTTTQVSSSGDAAFGENLELLASVATWGPVSGSVQFYDDQVFLAEAPIINGKARLSLTGLTPGMHWNIRAVYPGDSDNAPSEGVLYLYVDRKGSVILNRTPGLITRDDSLTVQVMGGEGMVTFYDGTRILGTVAVVDGMATLSGIRLPAGHRTISVAYTGDENNGSSTLEFELEVAGAPKTTVLASLDAEHDREATTLYDRNGNVQGILDAEGYLTEIVRNAAGEVVETIQYSDRVNFDSEVLRTVAINAARSNYDLASIRPLRWGEDVHTFNIYDARGRLVGQVDGEGYLTETVYDLRGNVTQTTRYAKPVNADPRNATVESLRPLNSESQVVSQVWSAANLLVSRTNVEGTVTEFRYDSVGRLIQTTVAVGTTDEQTHKYRYDLQGRLQGELDGRGSEAAGAADPLSLWAENGFTHTYDAAGRRTSTTDANGHRTLFFYDAIGRLRYTVNALGEVTESRYSAQGQLLEQITYGSTVDVSILGGTQPGGLDTTALESALDAVADDTLDSVVSNAYNATGTLASTVNPLGSTTTYSYNAFREAIASSYTRTDGYVVTDTATYDRRGLKTESVRDTATLAIRERQDYDAFRRVYRTFDGNGNRSQILHDRLGRVVWTEDPSFYANYTTYDAFGRIYTHRDSNTFADTFYLYDTANRSVTVFAPGGASTTVHNRHGQTSSVTDGRDNTTSYSYDKSGNLLQTSTALTSTTNVYDDAGLLLQSTDANGVTTDYTYDAANRLLTQTVDATGLNLITSYDYDAKGQAVSTTDARDIVTTIEFDLGGQVLRRTVDPTGLNLVTTYVHDVTGQVLRVTDANHEVTQYTYDGAGRRILEQVDPDGLNLTRAYEYDAADNVTRSIDGNGNATRYAYDEVNRLVYTLDPLGNVVQQFYDRGGRMIGRTAYSVPIDTTGLPDAVARADIEALVVATPGADVKEIRRYDDADRLRFLIDGTGAVVEYEYDAASNLVEQRAYANRIDLASWNPADAPPITADATRDERVRRVYDELNRLTWQVDGAGAVTNYTYDANGNLVETKAFANALTSAALSSWDGANAPTVTVDASRDMRVRTVYDNANRAVWTVDALGSVSQMVRDANGNVVETRAYANGLDAVTLAAWDGRSEPVVLADDARDISVRQKYDAAGRAIWRVDGTGAVTLTTYDANGNVTQLRQFAGAIAYGAEPETAWMSPQDRVTSYLYDAAGRLRYQLSETDILNVGHEGPGPQLVTSYDYDGAGNLVRKVIHSWELGNLDRIDIDEVFAYLVYRPEVDQVQSMVYDAAGRLSWSVDGTGAVARTDYDGTGRAVRAVQYANMLDVYSFAQQENGYFPPLSEADVLSRLQPDAATDRITVFAHDSAGRRTFTVDALGGVSRSVFDAFGNETQKIAYSNPLTPPDEATSYQDGQLRNLVVASAANDRIEHFGFDQAQRLVLTIDALGAATERLYDGLGLVTETREYARTAGTFGLSSTASANELRARLVQDPSNDRVTRQAFDAAGQSVYTIDPLGYASRNDYDTFGRIVGTHRFALAIPASTPNTLADIEDAVSPDPADRTEAFTFDLAGRVLSHTDAMNGTEAWTFDALGNKLSFTNVAGAVWTYAHDRQGRMIQETSPQVELTTVDVGGDGRLQVDAGSSGLGNVVTRMAYDAFGNLTSRTEAAGRPEQRVTKYAYDQLGRQVRVQYPTAGVYDPAADSLTTNGVDGPAVRVEQLRALTTETRYDAFGNAIANMDVGDNISYKTYDRVGRVAYEVDALGYVTGYDRDAFGNATTLTRYGQLSGLAAPWPNPLDITQVAAVVNALDHSNDRTISSRFDRLGRAIEVTEASVFTFDPDLAGGGGMRAKATRNTYDVFGNLVQVAQFKSTDSWIVTRNVYDKRNQQIATIDAKGYVTTQAFDAAGNLTDRIEYAKPASGEGVTRNLMGWTGLANGDGSVPLPSQDADNDRHTASKYDAGGRKLSDKRFNVEVGTASGAPATRTDLTTTYEYDALGNLTLTTDALDGTTYSYYDALGRVRAVVEPTRASTESGAFLAPLTVFYRDAYGNVVMQTEYVNGASFEAGREGMPLNPVAVPPAQQPVTVTNPEIAALPSGWSLDGTTPLLGYVSDTAFEGGKPLYRMVKGAQHLFTSSEADRLARQTEGWLDDGIAGYLGATQAAGTRSVVRLYNAFGDTTLVSDPGELIRLGFLNWQIDTRHGGDGVVGWISESANGSFDTSLLHFANLDFSARDNLFLAGTVTYTPQVDPASVMRSDRTSYAQFDALGHVVQSTDAMGVNHYSSYNAQGLLAKEWQTDQVLNIEGAPQPQVPVAAQGTPHIMGVGAGILDIPHATGASPGEVEMIPTPALWWTLPAPGTTAEVTLSVQGQPNGWAPGVEVTSTLGYADLTGVQGVYDYRIVFKDASGNVVAHAVGTLTIPSTGTDLSVEDSTPPYIPAHTEAEQSSVRTTYRAYGYDALGHQTHVVDPGDGSVGSLVDSEMSYNGFGELIGKRVNGQEGEYFDYDVAGRMWRTNAGGGVDKVALYDALGRQTAEITSAGAGREDLNLDRDHIQAAEQVAGLANVRRTDTSYDLLGRVVSQALPERREVQGGVDVSNDVLSGGLVSSATPGSAGWVGTNSVHVGWNSLSGLGSGEVRVTISYVSRDAAGNDGPVRQRSQIFDATASDMNVSWTDSASDPHGGVKRVMSVSIEKKDIHGAWASVVDQKSFGEVGRSAFVALPDASQYVTSTGGVLPSSRLEYRLAGSSGAWTVLPSIDFGSGLRVDLTNLATNNYDYRVLTTAPNEEAGSPLQETVTASGVWTVAPQSLLNIGVAGVNSSSQTLEWQGPAGGDIQVIRTRVAGSAGPWTDQAIGHPAGNAWSTMSLAGLAGGTYEYELLWTHPGDPGPYAHANGVVQKVPGTPDQFVQGTPGTPATPAVGVPPIGGITLGSVMAPFADPQTGEQIVRESFYLRLPPAPAGFALPVIQSTSYPYPSGLFNTTLGLDGFWYASFDQISLIDNYGPSPGEYDVIYGYYPSQAHSLIQPWGAAATQLWKARVTVHSDRRVTMEVTPLPYSPGAPGTPGTPDYTIPGTPTAYGWGVTYPGPYAQSQNPASGRLQIGESAGVDGVNGYQRPVVVQNVDRWGNVLSITDPRSVAWKTTYRYNANNQVVEQVQTDSDGNAGAGNPNAATTRINYDALGRQVAVIDALGHVNGQEWDAGGNLVREIHADEGEVIHSYDAFGNRVRTVDAVANQSHSGASTGYLYDKLDRLIRTTRDDGAGRVISEFQRWDEVGRLVSTTNGESETIRYAYDLRGNLVRTTLAMGQATEAAYDALNRKIYEKDAKGSEAAWTYDYFGQLTGHKDIGGATHRYTYDNARQLIEQSSWKGEDHLQDQSFEYDAAGQLLRENDFAVGRTSTYRYDLSGRRIRETTVQGGVVYQDNHIAYDALGRMRWVSDTRATITIDYDLLGNRTRIRTAVDDLAGHYSDRYYQYDKMNRQIVVDAVDAQGTLGADGHSLGYDRNGNRTRDRSQDGEEIVKYDTLNRLERIWKGEVETDHRVYDNASRVVQSGTEADRRVNQYDDNGRLVHQEQWRPDFLFPSTGTNYYYDGVGNVTSTLYVDARQNQSSYTSNAVVATGDRYVNEQSTTRNAQGALAVDANGLNPRLVGTASNKSGGILDHHYDANGDLDWTKNVFEQNPANSEHNFISDAAGNVLYAYYRDTSNNNESQAQRQLVVNGEVLGRYGEVATGRMPLDAFGIPNYTLLTYGQEADFSFGYQGINSQYPAGSAGTHVVQNGDTLSGIAKSNYGNAGLWYLIAEANGLTSDADLMTGQVLRLPPAVSNANNADTFKPYDPSRIANDTPTMLAMPQDKGGCGGVGQVIVAVVAVVVAVVAPYAIPAIGALGPVAGGVVSAALGSVASQAVGNAIGVQDGFSWKQVALAAVGGGIAGGLSGTTPLGGAASDVGNRVVQRAVGNALTQGVAVATGLQSSFSWSSVAASALSAGVSQGLNAAMGYYPGQIGVQFDFGKSLASGLGGSLVAQAARGGKINGAAVAADAFGNILGDKLAAANSSIPAPASAGERSRIMGLFADGPGYGSAGLRADMSATTADQLRADLGLADSNARYPGVQLAAGPGFTGTSPDSLRLGGDLDSEIAGAKAFLGGMDSQGRGASSSAAASGKAAWLATQAQATSNLNASGAGAVRMTSGFESPTSPGNVGGYINSDGEAWATQINVAEAASPAPISRPGDSIQPLSDSEAFFAFNPAGRFAKGVGGAALDAWLAVPRAAVGVGNLARDAIGYASNAIAPQRSVLTGRPIPYQPRSALVQSVQQNGVAGTVGAGIVGAVRNAPGIGLVGALGAPNRDWANVGAQVLNTGTAGVGAASTLRSGTRTALEGTFVDFARGESVAPGFYRADPRQLRFTQSDASPNFVDRAGRSIGTIDSLVSDLRAGRVSADQVGSPLQVVMHEGKPFSIDNRRLVAFNTAEARNVPIQVVSLKDPGVSARFFDRFDPIRGEGWNIVITPTSGRTAAQMLMRDQGLINGVQLRN